MATFEYKSLDKQGRKIKGIIEADTPRGARQQLRKKNLAPLEITPVQHKTGKQHEFIHQSNRLKIKELALLTRQISALIRSGLPIEEVLMVVSQQSEKRKVKRILLNLRSIILEGQSLSNAVAQFPHAFPPLYRATVAAGESSGKLDAVMERLADHLEYREQMRQKLHLALIYPTLLSIISLLIVVGLLTFVVPEIVGVFDNLNQQLPPLTQGLITLSEWLKSYGVHSILGLLICWLIFKLLKKNETLRLQSHYLILNLPLVGRFSRYGNTASFTRTLAILTSSGVELLQGLQIAGQVTPNLVIKAAIQQAAEKVREGGSLSQSLAQSSYFPPIAVHLIASGESGGQMSEMLESAAINQEREAQSMAEIAVGLFEPVLILLMGGIVLTIVIAILLPIFEMNQLIQ